MSLSIFCRSEEIDTGNCVSPMVDNTSCFREGHRPMVEDYGKGCHVYVTFNRRSGSEQDDQRVIAVLKQVLAKQMHESEFIGFLYRKHASSFVLRLWLLIPLSDRQQLTKCLVDIFDKVYSDSRIRSKLTDTYVADLTKLSAHSFDDYKKSGTIAAKLEVDLTSVVLSHLSIKGFLSSLRGQLNISSNHVDPNFGKLFATTVYNYDNSHLENHDLIETEVIRLFITATIKGANTGESAKGYHPCDDKLELYWRSLYDVLKCLIEAKLVRSSVIESVYTGYLTELLNRVKDIDETGELSTDMKHLENLSTAIAFAVKLHRCNLSIKQPFDRLVEYVDDDQISTKVGTEIARVFLGELCFQQSSSIQPSQFKIMVGQLGGYFMVLLNLSRTSPLQIQSLFASAMKGSSIGEVEFNNLSNIARANMSRTGNYPRLLEVVAGFLLPVEVAPVVVPIDESKSISKPKPKPKVQAEVVPVDSGRFSRPIMSEPMQTRFDVFKPQRVVATPSKTSRVCENCGLDNHSTSNCRFPPKDKQTCHKCGKHGHLAPVCGKQ